MAIRHSAYRVGISGSYGGMNLGDEAILEAIVAQLRAELPVEITVLSRDAADTMRRHAHAVDHAVPIRDLSRQEARDVVAQFDVLVLGGGGILYDQEAESYLREVTLAHEVGVPVMVYAISAGPLDDPGMRTLVRDALSPAAAITVRDRQGQQLLERIGVTTPAEVTADPALLLEPDALPRGALKQEGLNPRDRLIGMSVREPGPAAPDLDVAHYFALLANAADFMIDRLDAHMVFVPLERRHLDIQNSHAVVAQIRGAERATVLKGEYTARQMISMIGHFQLAIGMRLHFLIFAALSNVPFIALPYASKVHGLLEALEMPTPPLHNLNSGRLIAAIDRAWDMRGAIREQIQQRLPGLQQRARRSHARLVRLLTERSASASRSA